MSNFAPSFVIGCMHDKNLVNFTLMVELLLFSDTPPAPSRPSALEVKQDSIAIEWDEDQCTGGHTIQSFTIQYFETDNNPIFPFFGFFWHIRNIDGTLRNYTITGLDPETSYSIGVQTTSVDGRVSFYSASAEIVTLPPGMIIIASRDSPLYQIYIPMTKLKGNGQNRVM